MSSTYLLLGTAAGLEGGAFDPLVDLTDAKIWLKARGSEAAGLLPAFGETGGSLVRITQGTEAAQPLKTTDAGKDVVIWDGGDDVMAAPAFSMDGDFSIYAVMYSENLGDIFWSGARNANFDIYWFDNTGPQIRSVIERSSPNRSVRQENVSLSGTTYQMREQHCAATHATNELFLNGTLRTMVDGSETSDPSPSSSQIWDFGAHRGTALFAAVHLKELILCTSRQTTAQDTLVRDYLTAEHGPF